MNPQKIVQELRRKYPDKVIVQNKQDGLVTEILCEVEPTADHPDWSNAIVVVDKVQPHFHELSTEIYKVTKGTLILYVEDEVITLKKDEKFTIEPPKVHWATGEETWIECRSEPGWTVKDHYLVDI